MFVSIVWSMVQSDSGFMRGHQQQGEGATWCASRGGDSYMEQTGMLVGNFEFNP